MVFFNHLFSITSYENVYLCMYDYGECPRPLTVCGVGVNMCATHNVPANWQDAIYKNKISTGCLIFVNCHAWKVLYYYSLSIERSKCQNWTSA